MAPRVYIASKIRHAEKFRLLREQWRPTITINSRWLDVAPTWEADQSPEYYRVGWMIDHVDVVSCGALLVYGEVSDVLSGALVEVGIAIAHQKKIFVCGESPSFGSWINHPSVIQVASLTRAYQLISMLFSDK